MPETPPTDPKRRSLWSRLAQGAVIAPLALAVCPAAGSAEPALRLPAPAAADPGPRPAGSETAVLAGGCFWGVQAVFQHVKGVTRAVSGYAGGAADTAEYYTVGTGSTGHAEAVEVTFDPAQIDFGRILQVFFSVAHDPTQLNRQGPDIGSQYRSAIFARDDRQRQIAETYIAQLDHSGALPRKIATQVGPALPFYSAEPYHQDYATLHPNNGYIVYNDLPKIANLKALFPELYRPDPVLVSAATGG